MQINIFSKNMELTDAIRSYVEEKIHKLDRYLSEVEPVEVDVRVETNKGKGEKWKKIEVTMSIPRLIIRSEELGEDLYAVIDIIQEKLERKIRDNKERIIEARREISKEDITSIGHIDPKELEKIIRRKSIDLGNPISENEAADRMELLGHDFYFFLDVVTGQQKIVYRRRDGGYGIIESK